MDLGNKYPYPAGQLYYKGRTVDVVFMHYNTFEIGRSKWRERLKRVNLDSIIVLYEHREINTDFMENFSKLKYKKAVISKPDKDMESKYDFYVPLDIYKNWRPGKILQYKSLFSLSRWIEDWDYIKFLS